MNFFLFNKLTPLDRVNWLNTAIRCLLAIVGSYVVASVIGSVMVLTLSMAAKDATMTAIMLGFLIQLIAVMWVFHAKTLIEATVVILLPCAVSFAVLYFMQGANS